MPLNPATPKSAAHDRAGTLTLRLRQLRAQRWVQWLVAKSRQWRFEPYTLVVAICGFFALRCMLPHALAPLGTYDEGLLFTNAQLMNDGKVIYRDFYSNYPPGVFQIVRATMLLGLPPVWTMRVFAIFLRVFAAVAAGRLAGRLRGERMCWATSAVVLMLQSQLSLIPFAYSIAVAMAFALVARWPHPGVSRARRIGCGLLFGSLTYVRHDVFGYTTLGLLSIEGFWWLTRRRSLFFGSRREFIEFTAAIAAAALVLWVPVFIRSGVSRVAHDIAIDLAKLTMPARVLPLPEMTGQLRVDALNWTLPIWMADRFRLSLVLTAIGVTASLVGLVHRLCTQLPTDALRTRGVLTVLALATVPQVLGRTDYPHAVLGIALVVAAMGASLSRRVLQLSVLLAVLPWFAERAYFGTWQDVQRFVKNRTDEAFMRPAAKQLAEFVQAQTKPGEAIFVGCTAHHRLILNSLEMYYWAERPGATRYLQFDPGLITSAQVQAEMIADLEQTQPSLILRYAFCLWDEPNASRIEGAHLLDNYIASHYAPSHKLPAFEVWRRQAKPSQPN